MNLLLLEAEEVRDEGSAIVVGARAEHVYKVLLAQVGRSLRVGVRGGRLGEGYIRRCEENLLELESITWTDDPPPRAGIGLLLAMPRPKALRRILPAVASLGVDQVVLLNAVNVDKSYWGSPLVQPEAIRRLLDLGLEQAIDTRSPQVVVERRFRPFVEDELPALMQGSEKRWLLHPQAEQAVLTPSRAGMTWMAIGPETGWTPFELLLLAAQGFVAASLGPRMLRVETVVPYAIGGLRAGG